MNASSKPIVIHAYNPFNPAKDRKVKSVQTGTRLSQSLLRDPALSDYPIVALLNGEPVMRAEWDITTLQEGDIAVFYRLPLGGGGGGGKNPALAIVGLALIVGGSFALAAGASKLLSVSLIGTGVAATIFGAGLLNPPEPPSTDQANQLAAASPSYSLPAQGNSARIGASIPVMYGRNQIYPDFATQPYFSFSDNDQFLYHVLVIGQGEHDIHAVRIEDTPIDSFEEITWEKIEPGGRVTLFADNVVSALEVSGQELRAPNDEGDWIGEFTLNPSQTTASKIAIDISAVNGVYELNSAGELTDRSVSFQVDARRLNDDGEEQGGWITLGTETITAASRDAIRISYEYVLATRGRYEVRVKRTTDFDESTTISDGIRWAGARAFLTERIDYGDLTLLAVKMRATENLSDQSSRRINALATRKIPVWTPSNGWSANTATSSMAWAVADGLRNARYGAGWQDADIDLQGFYELDQILTARGDYFNAIFDRRMSIWEALRLMCRSCRSAGILQGGIFRIVRDRQQSLPVAMFTTRNILKNSFSIKYQMASEDTVDGVSVEFVNPKTWRPQEIAVNATGGTPSNPAKVVLFGCTSRDHARREALYLARNNIYRRKTINFTTELEGYIPAFGDLVVVSHDMPDWGTSGDVISVENGVIRLSEPLDFVEGSTHYIAFRTRAGGLSGAWACSAGRRNDEVVLDGIWTFSATSGNEYTIASDANGNSIRLYFGSREERTHFSFGASGEWAQYGIVKGIKPRGDLHVDLQLISEDTRVHQD